MFATAFAFIWSRYAGNFVAAIIATLVFISSTVLTFLATLPVATEPPTEFRTYRGLVTKLVAMNYAKLSGQYTSWNPTDVWIVLQTIIVEQLGVQKELITPIANFQYDLGAEAF